MKSMRTTVLGICLLLAGLVANAQVDREAIWKETASTWSDSMTYSARFETLLPWFLGTPYEEKTLDGNAEEELVIYTDGLDCVTFIENMLAIMAGCGTENPEAVFQQTLRENRYYEGEISGWESRIHYFSDWLRLYAERGKAEPIAATLGEDMGKQINFISAHPDKYPKMKAVEKVKAREAALNQAGIYFLPKTNLKAYLPVAVSGDILAITTNIKGLDVVHTGFARKVGGQVQLVHASSKQGKVTTTDLSAYLNRYKYMTGLLIYRPTLPNAE